jgi:hypothetical protein
MTLNYDVMINQGLRYETFKNNVLNFINSRNLDLIVVVYPNFLRPSVKNSHINHASLLGSSHLKKRKT